MRVKNDVNRLIGYCCLASIQKVEHSMPNFRFM